MPGFGRSSAPEASAPASAIESADLSNPNEVGGGAVKVALIVPLTSASGASQVGQSLRNAAELAVEEFGGKDVSIIVKDDQSSPAGARTAAQAALSDGAELILGPLFAGNVREVNTVARAAGKPVIAFSTDTNAAGRGTYLLSFLAETYIERVLDYAASRGKRSMAALVPNNEYGRLAEAQFMAAAARKKIQVMTVENYSTTSLAAAAQKIAALNDRIDSLFIPEQADAMANVSAALTTAGVDTRRVQLLGTGLWNDARVLQVQGMQGAWFAAPDNAGFASFVTRYQRKFGSEPSRVATLAYDAVALAIVLARQQSSQRFSDAMLQNQTGFSGIDGVFRFRADGGTERGLAVMQVSNGATSVLSPAPRSFSNSAM
jgi:ABC-type branched-subunit amino acid transport system substrate-binding protein